MRIKLIPEFFGASWLTLGGCGSALLAATLLATKAAQETLGLRQL
jgi:glycerol uptake facilitator-like aquaporin